MQDLTNPVNGTEALMFAHRLPRGAMIDGVVECENSDKGRLTFMLIGADKGVLHRAWSTATGKSETATMTFSTQVPNQGTWVGGVFALRGRNVDEAALRVVRLSLTFEKQAEVRPNIILLTLDTFRADCLSAMSERAPRTTVLDSLARAGVLFEDAVATSQCTNPSHVSILTGLYCFAHNVYTNHQGVSSEVVTLAEILKSHGYRTLGAVSARHLNPETSNLDQGIDWFIESRWKYPGGEPAGVRTAEVLRHFQQHYDETEPFFAWVHYFDPHTPYNPPSNYRERYPDDRTYDRVRYSNGMGRVAYDRRTGFVLDPQGEVNRYRGEVAYLDNQIGVLLNGLRHLGLLEKVVVVVVGDHGEGLGEHGVYFQHAGLFEPVIRVPLLLCGQGIPPGVRVHTRVSTLDIFPTVLALAGVATVPETYGINLVPRMNGEETEERSLVYSEAVSGKICAAWRDDLKYIWVPDGIPNDWTMPRRMLCFDLNVDPLERTNILESTATDIAHVKAVWSTMVGSPLVSFEAFQGHHDEERLRALGYLE